MYTPKAFEVTDLPMLQAAMKRSELAERRVSKDRRSRSSARARQRIMVGRVGFEPT